MKGTKQYSQREFLKSSAIGGLALTLNLGAQANEKADLVFHGGPILTVDAANSVKNAIAIKGNRILKIGKDLSDIQPFIGDSTKVIQLGQ